jgi:phage portal protein BeeE
MSFLGNLFKGFRSQKALNTGIFSFYAPSAIPQTGEKEFLKAYRGWVFACVNRIAEGLAEIDVHLETKTKDGWRDYEEDHQALDLLHKVNDVTQFTDLVYATQAYLELDGNSFWYMPRNGTGAPAELWNLDPTRVEVIKSQKEFISGYVFNTETGTKIPFEPDEMIHFKRFHPIGETKQPRPVILKPKVVFERRRGA